MAESNQKIIPLVGKTWSGKLVDPRPDRLCRDGVVTFTLVVEAPVQGSINVRYYVGQPVKDYIEVPAGTDLSKALSAHYKVNDKGIRIGLSSEMVASITDAINTAYIKYQKEQEQVIVTEWHWALGGDTHRVRIYPVPEKNTPDIDAIKDLCYNTPRFDDRIRPVSHVIDLDVHGVYTVGPWYSIKHEDLMTVIAEVTAEKDAARQRREQERQAKFDAALVEAKETGKPVILSTRPVECNNPLEQCDMDTEVTYVNPDGTTSVKRFHAF